MSGERATFVMLLLGKPKNIVQNREFIGRHIFITPRGDGELWFLDWDRCSFEGSGDWEDIKRIVLRAAIPPTTFTAWTKPGR